MWVNHMTLTQQGHISNRVMTQTLFQPAKLWKMIAILNGIHILSSKILETVTMQHLDYLVQEAIKPNYLLKQHRQVVF